MTANTGFAQKVQNIESQRLIIDEHFSRKDDYETAPDERLPRPIGR